MLKSVKVVLVFILLVICWQDNAVADGFTNPLNTMDVVYPFGDTHLGTDLDADAGTPVFAIADGKIFYYKHDADAYGGGGGEGCDPVSGEVIFVRHQKEDGSYFIAQYGHIQNVSVELQYTGFDFNGPTVSQGQQITEIGIFDPCRNCGPRCDHLHFGIWDSEEPIPNNHWGYNPEPCWEVPLGCWVDPIEFLENESPYDPQAHAHLAFSDDFDDGDAIGWDERGGGNWFVEDGAYVCQAATGQWGKSMIGNNNWIDYTIDVDVYCDYGHDRQIWLREANDCDAYAIILYTYNSQTLYLIKFVDCVEQWRNEYTIPFNVTFDEWHHFTFFFFF